MIFHNKDLEEFIYDNILDIHLGSRYNFWVKPDGYSIAVYDYESVNELQYGYGLDIETYEDYMILNSIISQF